MHFRRSAAGAMPGLAAIMTYFAAIFGRPVAGQLPWLIACVPIGRRAELWCSATCFPNSPGVSWTG
jgi:hypothetical protein